MHAALSYRGRSDTYFCQGVHYQAFKSAPCFCRYGYGDPLRSKVTPEFSIRIMDESYAAENKTISKVGLCIPLLTPFPFLLCTLLCTLWLKDEALLT